MNEELHFAEEIPEAEPLQPWQVLVVDDDAEVHAITRIALQDCLVEGRPLQLITAHSAQQARQRLGEYDDIALILLDVVMESEHAGLEFVHYVREEVGNRTVRIVLRTGQPGQAPARTVLGRYQIDDYRTKTELNFERLHVLVTTALRTYRLLSELAQKNTELFRSNQELERFAHVASHDLQTPLRGIISFTQLLERRYNALFDDDAREYMRFIVDGGNVMQRLISDLLEFSRLGNYKDRHTEIDLNELIDQVFLDLEPTVVMRGALLEKTALPTVLGNRILLVQLFRNLVDNALKFQPDANPWVRIRAQADGSFWKILVTDGGIGIQPEHREQIFDAFVRLHTNDSFPGSGVGLAICRKIVQIHGGQIYIQPGIEHGSEFVVRLPSLLAANAVNRQ